MLMYQKSMSDCYYCTKTFFRSKTCLKKFFFPVPIMVWKSMLRGKACFENAASRAKTNVIATVHVTYDVSFYDGPGMLIHKTTKPCINST